MKMRRLFVFFPLLIALTLVLAGCPSAPAPGGEVAPPEEAVEATEAPEMEATEAMTETEEMTETMEMTETEDMTGSEEMTGTEEMTETMEMTETEEMTGTTGGAMEGSTVQVSLVDGAIEMPSELPAGPTTFEITNNGTGEHGFDIEGGGVEAMLEPTLQPGESGTLEVDLQPGTYTAYCPVGDHRSEGMEIELTVQ
jgi:uncharacterized cupredoxin-like copper-binding protein